MKAQVSEKVRHVVLRGEAGDVLPDSLARALYEREVASGWLRASGVLTEVELRAFDTELGAPAAARRIAGPVQAIAIEGSVGLARGEVTVGMRAILARETDRGMETLAGEIVAARIVALEAIVTAFDDLALARAIDATANVWVLESAGTKTRVVEYERATEPERIVIERAEPPIAREPLAIEPAPKPVAPAWSEAIAASVDADPARAPARPVINPGGTTGTSGALIPPRPVRPSTGQDDHGTMPEAGDAVEHFAFGQADVVKSDGERLHLRVHKDGRIREIALEMLRVTPLESDGPTRRFRLNRRI